MTEINFAGVNVSSISDKLAEGLSKAKNLNKVILESCHLTKDLMGQMKVERIGKNAKRILLNIYEVFFYLNKVQNTKKNTI